MSNNSTSVSSKKKKTAAAAVAVALAAVMMIGGTFSYLSDSSVAVVNEFDGNSVYVELSETGTEPETDDDGNETGTYINDSFTIIPGTSETKDPQVTVTTTVDAYVYLVVTDNTQDLVDYTIDESIWIEIESLRTTDEDTGITTYVYYTTVDPDNNDDDGEQSFYALVSNTVYYSSSLTNEDIYDTTTSTSTDEEGNETTTTTTTPKSDITLTFQSYAIQSKGFNSALSAYYAAVNEVPTATVTVDSDPSTISLVQSLGSTSSIGTISPDITFTFTADENSTTAASSAYSGWYADFYVTFDVTDADTSSWNGYVAMAGQYENYNSTYWVPVIVSAYSSGVTNSYNLCLDVLGTGKWLTYSTLVSQVGTFNCGTVKEVTSDNTTGTVYTLASNYGISVPDGVVMTVELRLYKDVSGSSSAGFTYGDTYITVATYKYTY